MLRRIEKEINNFEAITGKKCEIVIGINMFDENDNMFEEDNIFEKLEDLKPFDADLIDNLGIFGKLLGTKIFKGDFLYGYYLREGKGE